MSKSPSKGFKKVAPASEAIKAITPVTKALAEQKVAEKKILPDLTPVPTAPTAPVAEGKPDNRKDGEGRRLPYVQADGKRVGEPDANTVGVDFYNGGKPQTVLFSELPQAIITGLTAFGLQTALTNAYNSARAAQKEGNAKADPIERFNTRLDGFKSNHWSARGTGEKTARTPAEKKVPLVVQAIYNDAKSTGKEHPKNWESWEAFRDAYKAKWHDEWTAKKRTEFQNNWLSGESKKGILHAYNQLLAAETASKLKAKAEVDFDDL